MARDFTAEGTKLAVGALVFAVLIAFLAPIAIGAFNEDTSDTEVQSEGNTVDLSGPLEANLTNVSTTNSEVTLEITDTDANNTISNTIANDSSATYSFTNGDVNATVDEIQDSTTAQISYSYEKTYGWAGGATSLFNLLPLFFILAILLFVVGKAMTYR